MPSTMGNVGEKVFIDLVFSVFGLPNQIHSDNEAEFVNKLWTEHVVN